MPIDIQTGSPSFEPTTPSSTNGESRGFRESITSAVDSGRETAASRLRQTASAIRGTDALRSMSTLGSMADNTASKLDAAAGYLEANDVERMLGQARSVVTRNPGASLAAAAALGFIVAAALKRND